MSEAHALFIPFPGQSHITPMMQLSKLLSSQGVTVTFVNTAVYHSQIVASQARMGIDLTQQLGAHIRMVAIDDGLPLEYVLNPVAYVSEWMKTMEKMKAGTERVIEKCKEDGFPVSCVVSDYLVDWAQDLADVFGIPHVVFWTGNVANYVLHCHVPALIEEGVLPYDGVNKLCSSIPGLMPLKMADFPHYFLQKDVYTDRIFQFIMRPIYRIREASCVLVNSIYELEREAIDACLLPSPTRAPIFPIGPLLPIADHQTPTAASFRTGSSVFPEEDSCLEWLDTHSPASVLYVAFGSLVSLSALQFKELALGLEASQAPFIWVVRSSLVEDSNSSSVLEELPEGFMDRTKGRGLVISWAPQVQVLSHPSVGGFVSHCGWNSIIESVANGVPILSLPQATDQKVNGKYVVDIWGVGIEFHANIEGGFIGRDEVERVVRKLMDQREGTNSIKENCAKWKILAKKATEEGGSSHTNLKKLVNIIAKNVPFFPPQPEQDAYANTNKDVEQDAYGKIPSTKDVKLLS